MARIQVRLSAGGQVGNFEVVREDGHTLSLSTMQNSLCEFSDGASKPVRDYAGVYSADTFLHILAEFLGHRAIVGLWDRVADTRALLGGYQVWEHRGPHGFAPLYQITKDGAPAPEGLSGYASADAVLKLKGIIK